MIYGVIENKRGVASAEKLSMNSFSANFIQQQTWTTTWRKSENGFWRIRIRGRVVSKGLNCPNHMRNFLFVVLDRPVFAAPGTLPNPSFFNGKHTDVPGISGSQFTLGLASLNLSSVHPFCLASSQQLSPGWIHCDEVWAPSISGHLREEAEEGGEKRLGDRMSRQIKRRTTAMMRKKGKRVR